MSKIFDFWIEKQDILREFLKDRFIPRSLWCLAVVGSTKEQDGAYDYAALHVLSSLITGILIDKVAFISPNEGLPTIFKTCSISHQSEFLYASKFDNGRGGPAGFIHASIRQKLSRVHEVCRSCC